MRRKIVIILLIFMIISETLILHSQNIKIREKNTDLLTQLEENSLIIDGKISLEAVKVEKENLQ